MPVVYGDMLSGNCYKIALLLSHLEIDYEWKDVDVTQGETRTEAFLDLNPAGQIPVVILDDRTILTQSNAILNYFADQTPLLPTDRILRTRILEWQFFEQYSHEPNIAVRRFINKYLNMPDDRVADYHAREEGSYRALQVMENRLAEHEYLVGDAYTIADISLYAYTHVADQAGLDLSRYPGVIRWLKLVRTQTGYISMTAGV